MIKKKELQCYIKGQIVRLMNGFGAMLRSFFHMALPAKGSHKDPTVWLDGARSPSISLIVRTTYQEPMQENNCLNLPQMSN